MSSGSLWRRISPWALGLCGAMALGMLAQRAGAGALLPLLLAVAGVSAALVALVNVRPAQPPVAPPVAVPAPEPAPFAGLAPLLEAMPDPALLIDREGRIVGSNSPARRQLQFEAVGLRLSSILRHPGLNEAAEAAAIDGATQSVEYETANQSPEHFRVYVAPVTWGQAMAALMVFHDQTTVITTERMRADFLANASHELKTPLSALSLLVETLTGPARGDIEAQDRFFDMMRVQAERMRRLIEDLLSLSRIELDERVPPSERADLSDIAREAADAALPLAATRGITVRVDMTEPHALVIGDRFQLAQVAQNLIDNAVKYAPDGGVVRVEVGCADDRDGAIDQASRRWPDAARMSLLTPPPARRRGYVYLRVEDTGAGIARRHLPRLGERFFRVERDEGTPKSGTGLGLAIVKHIANRHRGGVTVESIVGVGTAFAVYFERETPAVVHQAAE